MPINQFLLYLPLLNKEFQQQARDPTNIISINYEDIIHTAKASA